MKQLPFVLIFAALLSACNSTSQPPAADTNKDAMGNATDKPTTTFQVAPENLASLKDVVCGMSIKPTAIADTVVLAGRVYPFCSADCKKMFLADVAKYKIN